MNELHKSILKDAMINSFLAEKEKEHGTKVYTQTGIAKELANYIVCINKRWQYNPELLWEDYQTYFTEIPDIDNE